MKKLLLECVILLNKFHRQLASLTEPASDARAGPTGPSGTCTCSPARPAHTQPGWADLKSSLWHAAAAAEIDAILARENLPIALLLRILFRTPIAFNSACIIRAANTLVRHDHLRNLQAALRENAFAKGNIEGRLAHLQRTMDWLELRSPPLGSGLPQHPATPRRRVTG